MSGKTCTANDIKYALGEVLKSNVFNRGFYAPLMKRARLYVDDAVPVALRREFKNRGTCACTDGHRVFLDTECAAEVIENAARMQKEQPFFCVSLLEGEVLTLLVHEYTHLLMEHTKRLARFMATHTDEFDQKLFAYACDIEANRGYNISRSTFLYGCAVTVDKFPKLKNVTGLMNIYRALKEHYADDIKNSMDSGPMDMSGDGEGGGEENASQTQNKGSQSVSSGGGGSSPTTHDEECQKARERAIRARQDDVNDLIERAKQYAEQLGDGEDDGEEVPGGQDCIGVKGNGKEHDLEKLTPYDALRYDYNNTVRMNTKLVMSHLRNIISGGDKVRGKTKTYARQARRQGEDGLMKKGTKYAKVKSPNVFVGMDSSGSMHSVTMNSVVEAIGNIVDELGAKTNRQSHICFHAETVQNVQPLAEWMKVTESYHPFGQNDFDALLKSALEHNADVVLNVGDGYCGIWDKELIAKAKKRGLRWFDILINDNVPLAQLEEDVYKREAQEEEHLDRVPLEVRF